MHLPLKLIVALVILALVVVSIYVFDPFNLLPTAKRPLSTYKSFRFDKNRYTDQESRFIVEIVNIILEKLEVK